MRVGIAVPSLGFAGGLERYAFAMAQSLAVRGHVVTLIAGPGRGRDAAKFAEGFDAVVHADAARDASSLDVVYAQKVAGPHDLDRFGSVPVVIAAHDHDLTCPRRHRYLPISGRSCERSAGLGCVARGCCVVRRPAGLDLVDPFRFARDTLALGRRAPIVACSEFVARGLRRAGIDPESVHVIHPVLPASDRPLRPRPRARSLLVTGQLIHGKGFDVAIDALRFLPGDATLTIAGDGPSGDALRARADRVAPGRVRFLGYVDPDRVDDLYDAASVVLVPSRWPEPFGMVGLEAMRRARPVVGVAHGGIPEWLLEGAGKLAAPLDPRALAVAALELLDDPSAGERAAVVAAARFSHDAAVSKLEQVLQEAARPSRSGRSRLQQASPA
jgi:glycosyltransferase involved in cell wall biosynthesis